MGQAIAVRQDFTATELRRLATRTKDVAQARRLLAIAAILDGARACGSGADRRNGPADDAGLGDPVQRARSGRPDQLVSPGSPPKLEQQHGAFLARVVEEGPIPAVHGVVRWWGCDLIVLLHEEFGIEVSSDDTVYRALKQLGFAHLSARPRAYKQDAEAMEAFKKTSLAAWQKSAGRWHLEHR